MAKDEVNPCKLLIVGGSAGSIEVLMQVLPRLKSDSTFSMVIVLHRKPADDTILETLLASRTLLKFQETEDKTILESGCMYIAPSDYHMLFEIDGSIALDASEKVNYSRPSIDVSFESAALAFKKSVVAILLSGANSDGTAGLNAVKKAGGVTAIQNPATAEMAFMPQHAMNHSHPDFILNTEEIVNFINRQFDQNCEQ